MVFNLTVHNLIYMKTVFGAILLTAGLISTIITGISAIQDTETFSFLGMDIVIAQGDYSPVIISAIVLVLGVILLASSKGK